jgi:archaeal flagellin FlaB
MPELSDTLNRGEEARTRRPTMTNTPDIPLGNRGMMGIGALVIFIAMILVAAIAATVLITTGGSLQQKSILTGTQTEEGIAAGVEAVNVVAFGGEDHRVGDFKILARLQAGSIALNLNNTLITVDTDYGSYSFVYNQTVPADSTASSTNGYDVYYVQRGAGSEPGYLNRGDIVKILLHVSPEVGEGQTIRIKIIPKVGSFSQVEFNTPNSMTQRSMSLWPT